MDPHDSNQSQTRNHNQEGLFSHIIRSFGLGQDDPENSDSRANTITAEPHSHDVNVDDDENNVSNTGVDAGTAIATPSESIAIHEEEDMPHLQEMSDSEDEGADRRIRNPEVAAPVTSTPNINIAPPISIPMPHLATRSSQRRARVEDGDDDEGDRDNDRRHPVERISDAMRRTSQSQQSANTVCSQFLPLLSALSSL